MYEEYVDESIRTRKIYSLFTRETIPWALECENNRLNRTEALAKVMGKSSSSLDSYSLSVEDSWGFSAHYFVLLGCATIALVTLLTPNGPCFCFYRISHFDMYEECKWVILVSFVVSNIIQAYVANSSRQLIYQLMQNDAQ